MRPCRDPRRRNRNLGTAKQGRGDDNRLSIPWPDHRLFYERLDDAVVVTRTIWGRRLSFLVQPTAPGEVHACTVDDIEQVLAAVPRRIWSELSAIVLRRPTRKQRVLTPAWGRMAYHALRGRFEGPCIFLEAQDPRDTIPWTRRLQPWRQDELQKLREEGHRVTEDDRRFLIHSTLESIRTTQLYRTLLHEIGHWVHYRESVTGADGGPGERLAAEDAYWSKPSREKEEFAERFAASVRDELVRRGRLPFGRILSEDSIRRDGLALAWFEPGALDENSTTQ